ncbi:MAG: glycosyltransferase family 2 protein [Chloroflexi bacterium]|nr:glycosyltransferase family 2 protein [Chloroflexota bacterium]
MTLRQPTVGTPDKTAPAQAEGISVIVPAFNEENGIGPVLEKLRQIMAGSRLEHEILVVDDGSSDGTAAAIRQHDVRFVQHKVNKGYGAALKTGIRNARYPIIAITDADGTYPNERLPELVRVVIQKDADMAVGSRTGPNVSIPLIRKPAKWFINRLAETAAGQRIPDLNSGLRVFRRSMALRMFNLLPSGFSFTTTITLAMLTNGYSVTYVPIDYHERTGRSKIKPIRDTISFMQLVLRMALYFAPLKIFIPLSLLLLLLAVVTGLFTLLIFGKLADVLTLVLALSAFQTGALGLLAELINKRMPSAYREDE